MDSISVSVRDCYLEAGLSKKSYPAWIRMHFSKEIPDFPGIDSLKCGNFHVPLKRIYGIIASMKLQQKNKAKVIFWLSKTSKELNAPRELPLYSNLNNPLLKECYNFMMDFGKYHNNIHGMSHTVRTEQICDLSKRQKKLLENILNELGISLCLPLHIEIKELEKLYDEYIGLPKNVSLMDILFRNGFVDSFYNGPLIKTNFADCRILYILIIRHLWK